MRAPDETIAEYVAWDAVPEGERLRDRLADWAAANVELLKHARPERPDEIHDRLAECWQPQFAVADRAGGKWPEQARAAALELHGFNREDADQTDASLNVRVLGAVREAFGDRKVLWTADLLQRLNADDEAPWSGWNNGAGINARDLANKLRPFDVHRSADLKIDGTTRKGYRVEWFEDVWRRYLPTTTPSSAT